MITVNHIDSFYELLITRIFEKIEDFKKKLKKNDQKLFLNSILDTVSAYN